MRHRRGVSLLEVMIALAVIAIALLGIVAVYLKTADVKEANREAQIAKTAATRRFEQIRTTAMTNFNAVLATYQSSTFSVPGLNHAGTADKQGLGTVMIDPTNANLLDVRILIVWQGVRADSRYELRSLLSR
ncbi:MAG: prepilin-type N-terminal cleavage/methylation domain-containing protein [Planctomycetes bacterium]|nr:prepilin-type N-terminal cleavage/methylation domain-containing protein [Planctomycetota bacterium]